MKRKLFVSLIAIALIATILTVPTTSACKSHSTHKILFSSTTYLIGFSSGEEITKGNIIYTKGGSTQWISLDGVIKSEGVTIFRLFNTVSGVGHGLATYIDTFNNDPDIGSGIIRSTVVSKTNDAQNMIGSGQVFGYGSTDKYSSIIETATTTWHPTSTPFQSIVVTVTGEYTVQER